MAAADHAGPDSNNKYSLTALSNDGLRTPVSLWADPVTHLLQVSGSGGGGGGGTQYASGTATPSPVTGNALIFDDSGTLQDVSIANPLPVSATFSGTVNTEPTFSQNPGAGTPTAAYGLIDSSFRPQVSIATALPAGTNAIGSITNTTFAATQSGTWAVGLSAGSNLVGQVELSDGTNILGTSSHPMRIDPTGTTTQPISVVSLPLPTGAATSAKQAALGTAGTASTDVITVQGIASMTALKVDGSGVTQPISASSLPLPTGAATASNQTNASQKTQIVDGSGNVIASTSNALNTSITNASIAVTESGTWTVGTNADGSLTGGTAGSKSLAIGGIYNTSAPTLTTTQQAALQLDSSGNLKVNVITGGSGGGGTQYTELATTTSATGTLSFGRYQTSFPTLTTGQMNEPMLDSSSRLLVNGSGVTQPVSGTVTANAGTGNFTVVQSTASSLNATVVGTGTFAAQVTGTVTANAGTNLNTSALALESGGNLASIKTDVDNLNLAQASTTSGQKGNLILGAVTTSAPTYTTAQSNPLSLDTSGNVRTSVNNTVTITGSILNTSFAVTNTGTFAVQAAQSGTWTNTVTQATASNLNATVRNQDGSGNNLTSVNGAINVVQSAPTGTLTQVNSSATSVTVLASNTSRKGATFYNNSTAILYLAFGSTASTTAFTVPLAASTFFEMPSGYNGIVSGIWATANGNVEVTEIT